VPTISTDAASVKLLRFLSFLIIGYEDAGGDGMLGFYPYRDIGHN